MAKMSIALGVAVMGTIIFSALFSKNIFYLGFCFLAIFAALCFLLGLSDAPKKPVEEIIKEKEL